MTSSFGSILIILGVHLSAKECYVSEASVEAFKTTSRERFSL